MTSCSPYIYRFDGLTDRDAIFRKALYKPDPLIGLETDFTESAVSKLRIALTSCFYPTKQCMDLLERFVQICRAHSERHYQDPELIVNRIFRVDHNPLDREGEMLCLTGLAGMGKSHLMHAFSRVVSGVANSSRGDRPGLELETHRIITIDQSTTPKRLWGTFTQGVRRPTIEIARKSAFLHGISLLFIDEIQFGSLSLNANAKITSILLHARMIGIPVVFIANFSLMHTLSNRNNQDLHRLFADKVTLVHESPIDQDWINTLRLYQSVLPDVFEFNPEKDAERMFDLTFGVRRATIRLLEYAYRTAHGSKGKVGMAQLEQAYKSEPYSVYRRDTEQLHKLAINSGRGPKDLFDPLQLEEPYLALKKLLTERRQSNVNRLSIEQTYSPEERKEFRDSTSQRSKSDNVHELKKNGPKPLTAEDMMWAEMFFKTLK